MKAIPKVGNIWASGDGREVVVRCNTEGLISYTWAVIPPVDGALPVGDFTRVFEYIPQDELEWLACNAINPFHQGGTYIYKVVSEWDTTNNPAIIPFKTFTRQQWQDKRNELFGIEGKPVTKMKVEYVECNCKDDFWRFAKEHQESGNFYYIFDGNYSNIESITVLASQYKNNKLYRKVETPVTWQGEVNDYLKGKPVLGDRLPKDLSDSLKLCQWDYISDADFVGMCHLVASLTDKPD